MQTGPARDAGHPVRVLPPRSRRKTTLSFAAGDFVPALKTRLLILQPTPFCNIDCSYCYLPDRGNRARMAPETIFLAARRLLEDGLADAELTVVWHAGEPLTMPPIYYEGAFDAIARGLGPDCRVTHSMQTNATLVDDSWCEFFDRHQVRIGVSVDGPAHLHDAHRRTRTGKGTHEAVLRGLAALRRHSIAHHAIAVVTAGALSQADAIHDFFQSQEIADVGFNFDEAEGGHAVSSIAAREGEHRDFLDRMLMHMHRSAGAFRVRELSCALQLVGSGMPRYAWRGLALPDNSQTVPFSLVTVGWNGDFSTFSPEWLGQANAEYSDFVLGNVHTESYLGAARGEAFAKLWSAVSAGVTACQAACPYFGYCGGGAPANKFYENGAIDSTETLYCRSMMQRPLEAVLSALGAGRP